MDNDEVAFVDPFGTDNTLTPVPFSEPPADPDVVKLARLTVRIAHSLHRQIEMRPDPPELRWFKWSGPTLGVAPRRRGVGYYVALSSKLRGEKLVHVALHEARHVFQHVAAQSFEDDGTSEQDATAFAAGWAEPVMTAWTRCRGETSRISVVKGAFPTGWAPPGDIRIAAGSGAVFDHGRLHGWTKLAT